MWWLLIYFPFEIVHFGAASCPYDFFFFCCCKLVALFMLAYFMLLQALLDYERHKTKGGELTVPIASHSEPINIENQVLCELLSMIYQHGWCYKGQIVGENLFLFIDMKIMLGNGISFQPFMFA